MGSAHGQIVGVHDVVRGGPTTDRWNLVILAEGYTANELPRFHQDAALLASGILATPPFDVMSAAINVVRIDVASDDSGADDPCNASGSVPVPHFADTYFDATYCEFAGFPHLLVVDRVLAEQVLNQHAPYWHAAIALVNSATYGGSGYPRVAVSSVHPWMAEMAVHELGHSAFGLADEYMDGRGAYAGVEPADPNATTATSLASLKWGGHVVAATMIPTHRNAACHQGVPQGQGPPPANVVGTFEGAARYECGLYRPAANCRMADLGAPFCAVCAERIATSLETFMP